MRAPLLGQVIRFGVVGGICSALYAAVYLSLAYMALPSGKAVLAVAPAFAVAAAAGYYLHGAWSFRGHGSRDRPLERAARFLAVQAAGLGLNAAFTWLIADILGGPAWLPLLPSVTVTPLVTFILQRQWVYSTRPAPSNAP